MRLSGVQNGKECNELHLSQIYNEYFLQICGMIEGHYVGILPLLYDLMGDETQGKGVRVRHLTNDERDKLMYVYENWMGFLESSVGPIAVN